MGRILILVVLLIVYGSLYPWHFAATPSARHPFWTLLNLGQAMNRFLIRDAIVNIALYLPLGMSGYLTLSPRRRPLASVGLPLLGGLMLSVTMELIQSFEPTRFTSALDVVTNVAGTAIGIVLGIAFETIGLVAEARSFRAQVLDRGALALVFLWAGYVTFPWFPMVGLYGPGRKLIVFLQAPPFALVPFLSGAAVWFGAAMLLRAAGLRRPLVWLMPCLLVIPLQIFLVDRQPALSDLTGAVAGLAVFAIAGRAPVSSAVAFLAVIVVRGLAPFHPVDAANPFTLIPFAGFLGTQWQQGLLILLEKGFYYGTAVWLFRAAGFGSWRAAGIVAAVLLAVEIAQIHLPGRTAEITDPVLALLVNAGLAVLSRRRVSAA